MPRNEDMVYSLPAGTEAVTGTTIESAKYNIVLRDLEAEANAPRPIAAGGTGTNSLAGLQALVGYSVDSIASLVASSTEYPVGATVQARQGGTTYRVVAANGQHVTAGGVHLIESGPMFTSRDRLRAAIAAGAVAQGQAVQVSGIGYVVDSAATGMASAMWDIGINGVRAADRPQNAYIAGFHDHNSPRVIRLYASADGQSWRLLNALPLEHDTGQINGGNPVIAYRDGWFYIMVSFYSPGNYDFRLYKTRDFTSFEGPFNCTLGPTPICSDTNPAPGGTVPATQVWGADMVFTPAGELHVFASLPYRPSIVDFQGRTISDHRTYRSKCTDLSALTFTAPQIILPGGDDMSMIDASATRTPTKWLLNIKDSFKQSIRVYSGPSVEGPWTFQEEIVNAAYSVEGSSIVPRRLSSGAVAYDLYAEAHNTSDAEFIAAQQILLYRGNTSAAGWGAVTPVWLKSTRGIRHGTPLNLGFEDPAAYRAAQHFLTFADGSAVINNEQWNQLNTGGRIIIPNHGAVYYIDSGVTNLTILDGAADEFYLACLSDAPDVGITVQQRGFPNAWSMVGFGINNAEMVKYEKRPETGRYYPVGGRTQPFLEVSKGGTDQAVSGAGTTVVTFGTELIDIGGFFSGSVWTPPPGRYRLVASVTFGGSQSGELNFVSIRKNGTVASTTRAPYSDTDQTLVVEAFVTTQGGSTFDVVVGFGGSGSKTIRGGATVTWMVGAPV